MPDNNGEVTSASRGRRRSQQMYQDNNPILYGSNPPSAGSERGRRQSGATPPLSAQERELYRLAQEHGDRVRAQRQGTNPIIH